MEKEIEIKFHIRDSILLKREKKYKYILFCMLNSQHQSPRWPHSGTWDIRDLDYWYSLRCRNRKNLAYWQKEHQLRHNFDYINRHGALWLIRNKQPHEAEECYKSMLHFFFSYQQLVPFVRPLPVPWGIVFFSLFPSVQKIRKQKRDNVSFIKLSIIRGFC